MRHLLLSSLGALVVLGGSLFLVASACSSDPDPAQTSTSSSGSSGTSDASSSGVDSSTSSSGSSTTDSSSGGVGSDCGVYATVSCGYLFACAPVLAKSTFSDIASCQARYAQECTRVDNMLGAGALPASCTTAAASRPISCATPALPSECSVKGTLANGIVCENDRQCQSGYCKGALPCGRCDTAVAVNGSCESLDCQPGLLCVDKICKEKLKKDAACAAGECLAPLKCIGTAPTATCANPLQVGSPCTTEGAEEDPCDTTKGLRCTNGTCDAVMISVTNEACGLGTTTFAVCNGGAECVNKSCVAKPADGAACPETGPQCLWNALCTNGVCTLPKADRCK